MRRFSKSATAVVLLLLVSIIAWLFLSPVPPRGTASVVLLGVTNDLSGQRFATLQLTNASSSAVVGVAHSVDYKIGAGWLTEQPVPAVVAADLASTADLGSHESHLVTVRFPTNAMWRLRIRYHEQPHGAEGIVASAADLLMTLRDRARHVSYTGQSYLAETSEIVY
jgi:hypothetical protein